MNKGLTLRIGQMHGQRFIPMLLDRVAMGDVDPSRVFTHSMPLDQISHAFDLFKNNKENCIKVFIRP